MAIVISGSKTQVRKVVIGTPVKKVTSGAFSISNLGGVDVSGAENGAVIVYDADQGKFIADKTLEDTNITGGQYWWHQ